MLGLLLLVMFAFAHIHRFIMFRAEMAKFEARQLESARESDAGKNHSMALTATLTFIRRRTLNTRSGQFSVLSCIRPISASLLNRLLFYGFPRCI